jgi:iron complex outermembrane receptor protein
MSASRHPDRDPPDPALRRLSFGGLEQPRHRLPVWICTAGVNCADPTAPGRRLNPNNPFAAAYATDPANGAARIYYLFGDIPAGSERSNEVIRGTFGLKGSFGDDWNWRVDAVGARDNLKITQHGC